MIEKLEFAIYMHLIQKNLNIQIDSDLVHMMYEEYSHTYDNYSFFELYKEVSDRGIKLKDSDLSWSNLVKKIKAENINIPPKKVTDCYEPLTWIPINTRHDEYVISVVKDITIIDRENKKLCGKVDFNIFEKDIIIMPDGSRQMIYDISLSYDYEEDWELASRENCFVTLLDMDTNDTTEISGWELMNMLEFDNIQFEKSIFLKCLDDIEKRKLARRDIR